MPLKKSNTKRTSAKIVEGSPIQSPTGEIMSLFKPAMIPAVTLNTEQFAFPNTFLVREKRRVPIYEKNPETGWDLKDDNGNKTATGEFAVRLQLADGDAAQQLVDAGLNLDGLTTVDCEIMKDIPLQKFEPDSTLIKLVKPVIMLGYGGQNVDRIILKAEDCELV